MLVNMLQNDTLIYAIVACGALGILSKMVVSITLNRLVKSASNMSKSKHKFMKLVKAKFEHASMANNGVENVAVFVDKYIHEYKTLGMTLHSWQKIQRISLGIVVISGALGSTLGWNLGFGSTLVIQYATVSIGTTIILLAAYQVVDENHRILGLRIYMVDYLENVLAGRYEKAKIQSRLNKEVEKTTPVQVENQKDSVLEYTQKIEGIKEQRNVDNSPRNPQFPKGDVDNSSPIGEKIIVTNSGNGWEAENKFDQEKNQSKEIAESLLTETSFTGVSRQEASEILENRIQAVRKAKEEEKSLEVELPKFHIQTLEEEVAPEKLSPIEQMLQEEAQKRTIAKEQAGTSNTVNAAMIREILEEFMA